MSVGSIPWMSLTASDVVKIIAFFLPLLVAAVTKLHAQSWVKGGLHALLAAITGAVGVLVSAGGDYDWRAFVSAIITALVTSAAGYIVVWKHVVAPQIAAKTAPWGLGTQQIEVGIDKAVVDLEHLADLVVAKINPAKHSVDNPVLTPAPVIAQQQDAAQKADPLPPVLKDDRGAIDLDPLGYLLIVLGVVGIIVGLVQPLHARWALVPGIACLVIGVILWLVFGYRRHRGPRV